MRMVQFRFLSPIPDSIGHMQRHQKQEEYQCTSRSIATDIEIPYLP